MDDRQQVTDRSRTETPRNERLKEQVPEWADVFERAPIATMVVVGSEESSEHGRIAYANSEARALCYGPSIESDNQTAIFDVVQSKSHHALAELLSARTAAPVSLDVRLVAGGPGSLETDDSAGYTVTMHVTAIAHAMAVVQIVRTDAGQAVDRVLAEQQRFRSALMELSELAHTSEEDDEFYQRLLERAVEVVPGAQGGSVQLNVADTASFRFVAAVGYDLAGLQLHELEQDHFFRDAWNPKAQIIRDFGNNGRTSEITDWLYTVGRLDEIVVNVSAPVLVDGLPVAFLSLDNFEDENAVNETSVEMTTVLSRLIGDLWRRRQLEGQLRKERESFRHQALHDPLTGLANRRNLERSLDDMVSSAAREHRPSTVLFVDVDDFKGVNDRLGHEFGDQLLIGLANELNAALRVGDTVGRWGGDEFLFLPTRLESAEQAVAVAERVLARFEKKLDLGGGSLYRARLTVGVGFSADSQIDATELVRTADEALYEAKAAGKGVARLRLAESSESPSSESPSG